MGKGYFNNAVIGNSSMLGCVSDRGELIRLYWPDIDYPQHIEKMSAGIFFTGQKNSTIWFDNDVWRHDQQYIPDTNILKTVYVCMQKNLRVVHMDYVLPEENVLVRQYEIENIGNEDIDLTFICYSSAVSTTPELVSTLFDFNNESLIHYRHGYYSSISADREVFQFQLGNNAFESASFTELKGYDSIGMMKDGALSWKLGNIPKGCSASITLYICTGQTLKAAKALTKIIRNTDARELFEKTKLYWNGFLKNAKYIKELERIESSDNMDIDKTVIINLYKRSLLLFKLMWNKNTGGLLASPEIDEHFTRCGRYAYCWGRDAAFITGALDKCGLTQEVDKFYDWAVKTQDEDGSWLQRYYVDGNLAPSWGLQIDETGTLIWGMLEHYETVKDRNFLMFVWESVKSGVEFLIDFIDGETGLPGPSYDLWEERVGEHAYSSAAVYGGMQAGTEIAKILDKDAKLIEKWQKAADRLKEAILSRLWKEDWKRFLRSIRTKLNPWGSEPSGETVIVEVNPKGYYRDVTLEDWKIDVSLLGLTVPFRVFEAEDDRIKSTAGIIEQVLLSPGAGGIKRYENDSYIGGNPWVLTTLWVALYHIRAGNLAKAKSYFEWAVKARTRLDFLPEQVDRDTGEPAWVIPLTWSHAMFVHVLIELFESGTL
ncbi:MAG: glycoside hydrolase family 15 protein [Acetivibrionales bacterium]